MKIKIIYLFFLLALPLSSKTITQVDKRVIDSGVGKCTSSWKTVSLKDTHNFDANARYRIKVYNSDQSPNSGWIYPVIITPTVLYMTVSTAQFAFGAITSDRKGSWHYRKQGDADKRPLGYENIEWNVSEIQMILE